MPGGKAGRDGIERGQQPRTVPLYGVPADQGSDVFGRLQTAIVGQDDQVPRRDAGIGREEQPGADLA